MLGKCAEPCQKAVLDFLGELFVCSSSFQHALILNEVAGGMFHYVDGATTYGLKNNGMILYKQTDDTLLFRVNYFGCYILNLAYACRPDCNIDEYVSCSNTLEDRTVIYRFSKNFWPICRLAWLSVRTTMLMTLDPPGTSTGTTSLPSKPTMTSRTKLSMSICQGI